MRVSEMNWGQMETYLRGDDRAVLPIGSTEQHAQLSLATDMILAERVAVEAAEPLGVPVFPVIPYGITPSFAAYPGTVSLRIETCLLLVRDVLDSLAGSGFRRILIVNGHGGNAPVQGLAAEWMAAKPAVRVRFHNWYNAPKTWRKAQEIDALGSHGSWLENFPWTRLPNVAAPEARKPMIDIDRGRTLAPAAFRAHAGDGNFGGYYRRPDEEMLALWRVGVEETRALLADGW